MSDKINDFLNASKDEITDIALESDIIKTIVENLTSLALSEGASLIIANIIGTLSPRINNARLNYKQNRFERHVTSALSVINGKIDVLERNYATLNNQVKEKFSNEYLEWLLDNLYEEKQIDKVPFHVNGYLNLMNNEANDNLMLMFFNTINELTMLDIDVLNMYNYESPENIYTLCEKYNLDPAQTNVIKAKLERLGLLSNKNEMQRDSNIDLISEYLKKVGQEQKQRNPKEIKMPNIKKISGAQSYSITQLGRSYLKIISINQETDNQ